MAKRFETTTKSSLDVVVSRRDEVEDRGAAMATLKERKAANTTTCIKFGSDPVDYTTSTSAMHNHMLSKKETMEKHEVETKSMKDALTRTHFELGTDKVDYSTENKLPDPMAADAKTGSSFVAGGRGRGDGSTGQVIPVTGVARFTGQLDSGLKAMIRQSNLHMGDDRPDYKSTSADAMVYRGGNGDYERMRGEAAKLKKELTTQSFTLGNDKPSYSTDYRDGYRQYDPRVVQHHKEEAKKGVMTDMRSSHFVLGTEKVEYETDTMRSQKMLANGMGENPLESKERNKALKQYLMKTNYEIGNDPDYM
uniref:Uncharacterized protein n=1 Tax=Fibrocapsa japonica TaxID=94617 RepID=A0A7S2V4L9_9STRA|mmetsp:Transcript_6403/g.9717  ORF Transcript_6403/g.9717 Transcript_6403/m.9717 type:complete len:308 (+) Transcript_6403:85-1008(+)|eukprot:CAMPEP_0113934858 /NCGR_PEP_ID=MMETSP1339-20121228/2117_1 /TAXON_ID=94617 /ORGANISM="Fibrocapsa japonica" /LENGTH=307 /DNA_ID=CAMNT_0000936807 /DNA_START=48 /DNA_END=971 /DNA_ORIENTATION=- /assembly_acc=CAM_ASM_000762